MKNRRNCLVVWCLIYNWAVLAQPEWYEGTPLPAPRYGMAAVLWQDKLVVIGGRDQNQMPLASIVSYDLKKNTWEEFGPQLNGARAHAAAVVYGNEIFVIGGHDGERPLAAVESYNASTGRWSEIGALNVAREAAAAVIHNNLIHVIGGFDGEDQSLASTETYDTTSKTWTSGNWEMLKARAALSAVTYRDSIFVFGGIYFGPNGTVERYHSSEGSTWRAEMPTPRGRMAAVGFDSKIWVIGGSSQGGATSLVERFLPEFDSWETGPSLPDPREMHAAVSAAGKLYVIGGRDLQDNALATVEIIDGQVTAVDEFHSANPAKYALSSHPNPFTSHVEFRFLNGSGETEELRIDIVNLLGRKVKSILWNSTRQQSLRWNGQDELGRAVPSGVYFAVIRTGRQRLTHKLIRLRQQ